MKMLPIFVLLMAVGAYGKTTKPECKSGQTDPYHYSYAYDYNGVTVIDDAQPAVCVQGHWTLDKEAWKKRLQKQAADEAKAAAEAKAKAAHDLYLWNSLRTRVVTDAEMKEILEQGVNIIPAKDGGLYTTSCEGYCGDWDSEQSQEGANRRDAEIIFNNALLNQFKMRVLQEKAKP
jgi:hypothetical protein